MTSTTTTTVESNCLHFSFKKRNTTIIKVSHQNRKIEGKDIRLTSVQEEEEEEEEVKQCVQHNQIRAKRQSVVIKKAITEECRKGRRQPMNEYTCERTMERRRRECKLKRADGKRMQERTSLVCRRAERR